ncbi:ergothioneine biosynthesis PLP-dependent enzyme EgtE [Planomonospora venezuelensis]|uniref:Probable hercynylcysteine sulfoxide lyase n=1 Tax=Planomonospora venezuelensis TaxID=1999 RepID=A0A841DE82_PLAVE|nr:ergothioneine biosynthesis PLP-dependent enzyme EgtE [Planomonospora venezuelensis]MBB5967083.1 pyridoxal 5-phosphate dependent beta-lyase [Planomonospora venezuelensis]GIN04923.1 putative hercynylcysteine sulfoxide lyase [Planomonospora venezuelensis]
MTTGTRPAPGPHDPPGPGGTDGPDLVAVPGGANGPPGATAVADAWRAARSRVPPGHLDAAGCNVPSDLVLDAVVAHLRRERETGGYRAAADLGGSRSALAALVGADARDVAFLESGTAAMAALLGGWRLPPGGRVGFTRAEYGSTLMLLRRLARDRGWRLVEVPADGDSRVDPDGLRSVLAGGLDLLTVPHIASHRGVVQPARAIGRLCREAGVPLVLDVCQSLGHVDTGGVGAAAYVGTSRKWLAGPRGVGFLIVPGLHPGMDTAAPALGGHVWVDGQPSPLAGAARYETAEGAVAARAGLGVAVREHHALGPAAVHARLAELGATARRLLDGAGGWQAVEPLDEPSAVVTLRPPPGADPAAAVADAASLAAEASLLVGAVPVGRAPLDMPVPVLRVSPSPGTPAETLHALARLLGRR